MATKTLYARVQDANHDYVTGQAAASGLPVARILDAILEHARQQGWSVTQSIGLRVDGPDRD